MIIESCPECSGLVLTHKGYSVCSSCGIVIDLHVISDEMTFNLSKYHAPSQFDIRSIEIQTQQMKRKRGEYYRLMGRINQRFKKPSKKGFHHCPTYVACLSVIFIQKTTFVTFNRLEMVNGIKKCWNYSKLEKHHNKYLRKLKKI